MSKFSREQPKVNMAESKEEKSDIDDLDEGNYGDYRCTFRPDKDDSLYICIKGSKSKRTFTNTFSKSTLLEMGLKQSVQKIVALLFEAKSGKKEDLEFKIAFGDKETEKPSVDVLPRHYVKGYAMYLFVIIDSSYFTATYTFKLIEQGIL